MSSMPFALPIAARLRLLRPSLLRLVLLAAAGCAEPIAPASPVASDANRPMPLATSATAGGPMVIATGDQFSCAIDPRAIVRCWGAFNPGDRIAQTGTFTEIAAGGSHVCGLRSDGAIECWGTDHVVNGHYVRTALASATYLSVVSDANRACGLRSDSGVECWGLNANLQPMDELFYSPTAPFTRIAAGEGYSCGVTMDLDAHCWGRTAYFAPELWEDIWWVSTANTNTCFFKPPTQIDCLGGAFADGQLSVGYFSPVAVDAEFDGVCIIWESGQKLDCFDGSTFRERFTPTAGAFVQLAVSRHHGCAATDAGWLQCWKTAPGSWPAGDLGPAPSMPTVVTTPLAPNSMRVSWDDPSGRAVMYRVQRRLFENGSWEDWDAPREVYGTTLVDGPFAEGGTVQYRVEVCTFLTCSGYSEGPEVIAPAQRIRLAAGASHACALRPAGSAVECWGENGAGQAPSLRLPSSGAYEEVASGAAHSCALNAGVVECWGSNAGGQAPASKSAASSSFTRLTAGAQHTCALRADGAVECWGDNGAGQAPVVKSAAAGIFQDVAAGASHTCALRSDGVVECWGENADGRAPATRAASNDLSFVGVASGATASCALRVDGVAECWGSGGAAVTKTPASGRFTALSMGNDHACGRRGDGVVECWGNDGEGQAPTVRDPSPRKYQEIAAGSGFSCARQAPFIQCWGDADWIAPVQSVAIDAATLTSVDLSWVVTGGLTREVQRRSHNGASWGAWSHLATVPPAQTTLSDAELPGGRHEWRLRACHGMLGCTAWRSVRTTLASIAAPIPPEPPSVTAGGSQLVEWSPADGAVRYELRRATWNDAFRTWAGATTIVSTPATSFNDTGLKPDGRYRHSVRACNPAGCSPWVTGAAIRMPSTLIGWGGIAQLSASPIGVCALGADGTIRCGGDRLVPTAGAYMQMGGLQCGVTASGLVECWSFGSSTTWQASAGTFEQVSVASMGRCGVRSDANVECEGFLDVDEGIALYAKSITTGTGNFVHVAVGDVAMDTIFGLFAGFPDKFAQYAALRNDGVIVALQPGFPSRAASVGTFTAVIAPWQVGEQTRWCGLRSDGQIECWSDFSGPATTYTAGNGQWFTQAASGQTHLCALRNNGSFKCWGDNGGGQAPTTRAAPSGRQYTQVVATNGATCALRSDGDVDCFGSLGSKPDPVQGMAAQPTAASIVVDWLASGWRAREYRLERRTAPFGSASGAWTAIAMLPVTVNRYEDTDVGAGMRYEYRMRACNTRGCSPASRTSATMQSVLLPPGAIEVSSDAGTVTATWEDRSSDETGFHVQRRALDELTATWSAWSGVGSLGSNVIELEDTGVTPGVTYQYRVRSVRNDQLSPWVTSAAVKVP